MNGFQRVWFYLWMWEPESNFWRGKLTLFRIILMFALAMLAYATLEHLAESVGLGYLFEKGPGGGDWDRG